MIDEGIYDPTISYQKMCLYFSFCGVLQSELDEVKVMWNNHYIRHSREAECPAGKPDVLFYTPTFSGGIDCKFPMNLVDLELTKSVIELPTFHGYTQEIAELAGVVMHEENMELPDNCTNAKELYIKLVSEIEGQ